MAAFLWTHKGLICLQVHLTLLRTVVFPSCVWRLWAQYATGQTGGGSWRLVSACPTCSVADCTMAGHSWLHCW